MNGHERTETAERTDIEADAGSGMVRHGFTDTEMDGFSQVRRHKS